jgi:PAS domain S-box-containing protein
MEKRGNDDRQTGSQPDLQLLSRDDLESKVRERTAYLENLMDTMVDILIKLDPDGRISMVNQACEEILGYPESEVVGKPIDYIFAEQTDGEQLSSMLSRAEFVERLLRDRKLTDVEVTFETSDGETIPMSLSASVMGGEGGVNGMVCVAKDISERKAAEERAEFLQSLLRHDLGNKLQIAQGSLEVALDDQIDGVEPHIESALAGTEEAIELIENVRMLQKLEGTNDLVPVNLTDVIEEIVGQYEEVATRKEIEIEVDVEPELHVRAGSLLKEMLANLVENGLEHSGGSLIRITATEDEQVVVCIEDNGRGLPEEERERLLQKGVKGASSSGSGLGTYLARRIAESYGGTLTATESDLGGAKFEATLESA